MVVSKKPLIGVLVLGCVFTGWGVAKTSAGARGRKQAPTRWTSGVVFSFVCFSDSHLVPTWLPGGNRVGTGRGPGGNQVGTHGDHMRTRREPGGDQEGTRWGPGGDQVGTRWRPGGPHLVPTWSQPGPGPCDGSIYIFGTL